MAVLDIGRPVRFECLTFYYVPLLVDSALLDLSRHMACDDSPSSSVTLPWYLPHGPCDDHQHDRLRLCSCVGTLDDTVGKCGDYSARLTWGSNSQS